MNTYEFVIPAQLNGTQLKDELQCDLVYVKDDKLFICGSLTKEQATAGLEAHIPAPIVEPTIREKLASVGLSITDLKAALGLGVN